MTYLFLDTNSLIQFQDFESIKWQEICNDKDFIIVITAIVIREIDKHKDSSKGKLRERAHRVGKKISNILRGKSTCNVSVVYGDFPSKDTMKSHTFNKDINDDWLLHSVWDFKTNKDSDKKVVISNDLNMYTRALALGISVIELPDKYLLPQELTNEEKLIRELESKIRVYEDSCPKPSLHFAGGLSELNLDLDAYFADEQNRSTILERLKLEVPEKEYSTPQNTLAIFQQAMNGFLLTKEDYERYNSALPEYYKLESNYLFFLDVAKNISKRVIPLQFELSNIGHAPTGLIGLSLVFSNSAILYDRETSIEYLECKRVSQPKLTSSLACNIIPLNLTNTFAANNGRIECWNLKKHIEVNSSYFYYEYDPIIHNTPPIQVLKDTFFVYLGNSQKFTIHWKIIDSRLPLPIEGDLSVTIT